MSYQPNGKRRCSGFMKAIEQPAERRRSPDPRRIVAALTGKELLMRGGSCAVAGRARLESGSA
jgi:hypothetical protein